MKPAYCVIFLASVAAAQKPTLYSPDPEHIWNRVHRVLHVRIAADGTAYGSDELDPLLWRETKYLLTADSHRQALAILDEFLSRHAERMITDPVRRAVFQHDLWAVFDWLDLADPNHVDSDSRRTLQDRLVQTIRSVALNRSEIERLPDNLAEAAARSTVPNLAMDLFQAGGPWICLCVGGVGPSAAKHTSEFSGRSVFLPFLRLPGGREETLAYLKTLQEYGEPWIVQRDLPHAAPRIVANPALPQFPSGTRVALVRRMMVVDQNGEITPTRLTESVQIRDYRVLSAGRSENSEFRLSREKLFSGEAGAWRPVGPDEKEFPVFSSHGIDPFEMSHQAGELERHQSTVLQSCSDCHRGAGIHSVLSFTQEFGTFGGRMPEVTGCSVQDQERSTAYWKRRQHDLGLLEGIWSR